MRFLAAVAALALIVVGAYGFVGALFASGDTEDSTWVLIGFAGLGLAAPFAWLAFFSRKK